MSKRKIFDFLRDLRDNNNKEWFHANREAYDEAKSIWIEEIGKIYTELAKHDKEYENADPANAVERPNNNLLYHPEKPTYKSHFGFSPDPIGEVGCYVSIDPSESYFYAGLHNPSSKVLKGVQQAIDERGDELQKILDGKAIADYFGGLAEDEKKLKTSPKGFSQDNEHIELLRRKDFTVSKRFTQAEVLSDEFPAMVGEAYGKVHGLLEWFREV